MAKKASSVKYKKAPQAPRRFKSAYMFFSTEKHKEIRQELDEKGENGKQMQTTEVAKMVSQAWKDLSPEEREEWDEMARRDKARYEVEKTMYTGPWKVPAKKRSQKDPNAPKRPMSAFLSFSNSKRAQVKAQNPDVGNAEVSRILARMWKEAPSHERQKHIDLEYKLRQEYKAAIAEWKQNAEQQLQAVRKEREEVALRTLDAGKSGPLEPDPQQHFETAEAMPGEVAQMAYASNGNQAPMLSNNYPAQQFYMYGAYDDSSEADAGFYHGITAASPYNSASLPQDGYAVAANMSPYPEGYGSAGPPVGYSSVASAPPPQGYDSYNSGMPYYSQGTASNTGSQAYYTDEAQWTPPYYSGNPNSMYSYGAYP